MNEKKRPENWQEDTLQALYYAFAASEQEGLQFFLNQVLENFYDYPAFKNQLYEKIDQIKAEGIFKISDETLAWVQFWQEFYDSDKNKIPGQIEKLVPLTEQPYFSTAAKGVLCFLLAFMHAEIKERASAAAYYEQASHYLPEWSWIYNNWGISLRGVGQEDSAIEKYQKALKINPNNAMTYFNWGIALSGLGQHDSAIEKYKKALKIDPQLAYIYNGWGSTLRNIGQKESAIEKCKKALEIDPNYAKAYNNWGITLSDLGQHAAAIEKYQKALEIDPNYAEAYNNLGNALGNIGQKENAIEQYTKVLEIDPNNADVFNSLGYLSLINKDYQQALSYLEQAISLSSEPTVFIPLINAGICYFYLTNMEQARTTFLSALEKCTETSVLNSLNKVTALLGLERVAEARELFIKIFEKFNPAPSEIEGSKTDWQLLANAPVPPAGIKEFMEFMEKFLQQDKNQTKI